MRRTKQEVAPELPEKIEQEIVVPMADEQAKLYKQMLKQVRDSVMSEVEKQGVSKAQIQILAALTRLRQVACDPRLTKLDRRVERGRRSGKIQALCRRSSRRRSRAVTESWCSASSCRCSSCIRRVLDERGVTYEYLDGSTKDRQERVDRFNEDESITAFLISLKAGGTGLNLTGADTVVHFDPWWNPAVEDQATDRAHRIGQTKVVNVYKLIAREHGRGEDPQAQRQEARLGEQRPHHREHARSRASPRRTSRPLQRLSGADVSFEEVEELAPGLRFGFRLVERVNRGVAA